MRVLVNAVSIKEGGSMTVLNKLLPAMAAERPESRWVVAVNAQAGEFVETERILWTPVATERSLAHLFWWYELGLQSRVHEHASDVVFSVTNYLPHRRLPVPSLLILKIVAEPSVPPTWVTP